MITRRQAFSMPAAAALAVATKGAPAAAASLPDEPPAGPLFNLERAYKVLAEEGLDGLVLAAPLNFHGLAGFTPVTSRMGFPVNCWALLSNDPDQPVGLVMADFTHYYMFADEVEASPFATFLYTRAASGSYPVDPGEIPEAAPLQMWPDREEVPLSVKERHRRALTEAAAEARAPSADAGRALVGAMAALGLTGGRIGIDDEATLATLAPLEADFTPAPADHAVRRIRMVKSPTEIALMRRAAIANQQAALAAVQTVRAGADYREFRRAFHAEAAARGNRGVFMVIDSVPGERVAMEFTEGQALMIDCVSECHGYHGDFGRTIFIGEPARSMKRATEALALGWGEVRGLLRPGLRYSEIRNLGREIVRKAGFTHNVGFGCHSVGLAHTDEPGKPGAPVWQKDDLVLEPGMIISVDCPVINVGIGGSAHLEDLTLITEDGAEPIHPVSEPVVVV